MTLTQMKCLGDQLVDRFSLKRPHLDGHSIDALFLNRLQCACEWVRTVDLVIPVASQEQLRRGKR